MGKIKIQPLFQVKLLKTSGTNHNSQPQTTDFTRKFIKILQKRTYKKKQLFNCMVSYLYWSTTVPWFLHLIWFCQGWSSQSCSNLPLHLLLAWPTAVAAENLGGIDMARFISTPAKNRKQILIEIHYPAKTYGLCPALSRANLFYAGKGNDFFVLQGYESSD